MKPILYLLVLHPIYRKVSVSTETSNTPLRPVEVPWRAMIGAAFPKERSSSWLRSIMCHPAKGSFCVLLTAPPSPRFQHCPRGSRSRWGGRALRLGLWHLWSMGCARPACLPSSSSAPGGNQLGQMQIQTSKLSLPVVSSQSDCRVSPFSGA